MANWDDAGDNAGVEAGRETGVVKVRASLQIALS